MVRSLSLFCLRNATYSNPGQRGSSLQATRHLEKALLRLDSLHLAHHILRDPSILLHPSRRPKDIGTMPFLIELGAGTGFLSILLAQLNADVIATDLDGDSNANTQLHPLARLISNLKLSQ